MVFSILLLFCFIVKSEIDNLRAELLPCFVDTDCPYTRTDIWICDKDHNEIINSNIVGNPNFTPTLYTLSTPGILDISPEIENYDHYIQKYLWALIRATLSGETIGKCKLNNSSQDASAASRNIVKLDVTPTPKSSGNYYSRNEDWVIDYAMDDFSIPNILQRGMITLSGVVEEKPRSSGNVLQHLGEINCIPLTRIGIYSIKNIIADTDDELLGGMPVPNAFSIEYRPIIKTTDTPYIKYSGSIGLLRYVAEPYELVISTSKLEELSNEYKQNKKMIPQELAIKRSTLRVLLRTLGELVSLGQIYKNKNAPLSELLNYVEPGILSPLATLIDILNKDEHDYIYFNFFEKNHNVDIFNGTLPITCDFIGEGLLNVEIFSLFLYKKLLDGLSFALGQKDYGNISIQQLIDYMTISSFATNECTARIICSKA